MLEGICGGVGMNESISLEGGSFCLNTLKGIFLNNI